MIAAKVALASAPPLTVAALRLLIAALCFAGLFVLRGLGPKRPGGRAFAALFGLSLLGTGLHYGFLTIGLQFTTAAHGSIYSAMGPIFIVLIAAAAGQRVTLRQAAGIALALCGALAIQGLGALRAFDLRGRLLGDALVLLSILMWGLFTVFGQRVVARIGPLAAIGWTTIIGAIWMLPVAGAEMAVRSFAPAAISLQGWLAIAFLGIGCTFLAPLFYFIALEHASASKVSVYLYAVPPLTYVLAALFLKEPIGVDLLIGSVLVLGGVYLTERG